MLNQQVKMPDFSNSMKINIFSPTLKCQNSYETKDITLGDWQQSVSIYESESQGEERNPYDSIMKWFEQRNIRRGNPETIIEEYENGQKKNLLSISKREKTSESVNLSPEKKDEEDFGQSSLLRRRNLNLKKSSHF